MYFEIIDKKTLSCNKLFINNSITDQYDRSQLSSTWDYNPEFKDLSIKYGSLYSQGKNLLESCPNQYLDQFKLLLQRYTAFQKSLRNGKVCLDDSCFYDLIPLSFTKEFFRIRSLINQHVVETYPKPSNYDFLVDLSDLIFSIRQKKLNLNLIDLTSRSYDARIKQLLKKFVLFLLRFLITRSAL
jgi:hypothetical protein